MTAPAFPHGIQLAECRKHDAELFFPRADDHTGIAVAKAICAGCPIQDACRPWALQVARDGNMGYDLVGVWGGLSEIERDYALAVRDLCCTARGYDRHVHLGEVPCPGCRRAKRKSRERANDRQYRMEYRRRLRAKRRADAQSEADRLAVA